MNSIKKIVVIGPESSGKTTLCKDLAAYYQTSWIPEYARTYLEENGSNYQYEDLEKIARGQLKLEDAFLMQDKNIDGIKSLKHVFFDTNLEVIKIWSHVVYGKCHHVILQELSKRRYDFYLICKPDLDWESDPMRENPDAVKRWTHYHMYLDSIVYSNIPFAIIEGKGENRFNKLNTFVN